MRTRSQRKPGILSRAGGWTSVPGTQTPGFVRDVSGVAKTSRADADSAAIQTKRFGVARFHRRGFEEIPAANARATYRKEVRNARDAGEGHDLSSYLDACGS